MCGLFLCLFAVGGWIAMRPRFAGNARGRKQIARAVSLELRTIYPHATIGVRANPCRRGDAADVTIYLIRKEKRLGVGTQYAELRSWFTEQFPDLLLERALITTPMGHKMFLQEHDEVK